MSEEEKKQVKSKKSVKKKVKVLSRWARPKAKSAGKELKNKALIVKNGVKDASGKFAEEYIEGTKLDKHIDSIDDAIGFLVPRKEYAFSSEAVEASKSPIRFGMWMFFVVFVLIGGWSACAPLNSAAVAPGTVVLSSNKKVIQHLEGGIIKKILVEDGDAIEKGQTLLIMNDTRAKATSKILSSQLYTTTAVKDRLLAERDGLKNIKFDKILLERKEMPEIVEMMDSQSRLFRARDNALEGQFSVLDRRINQLNEEIIGLRAQEKSSGTQLGFINEEIEVVEKLVKEGRAVKPRLLALKRTAAELEGRRGSFIADIARAKQAIAENELTIINLSNERQSEVIGQLRDIQANLSDIEERVEAASDVLSRTIIKAHRSGIVTGLKYHTIGGVIQPGAEIMTIVPQDDELIIEAQVRPMDIDVVHKGLRAKIRLSAFSSRRVPMVEGEVMSVSADSFVNKYTGKPYFLARIRVDKDVLNSLTKRIELYPGMTAETLIVIGERTVLSYIMDPITSNFNKAFREQ